MAGRGFVGRVTPRFPYNGCVSTSPPRSENATGPHYYGEQDENGIDLSLIRENLRLTPLERVRKHDAVRQQILKLLEYGRRHREDSARTDR